MGLKCCNPHVNSITAEPNVIIRRGKADHKVAGVWVWAGWDEVMKSVRKLWEIAGSAWTAFVLASV